MKNHLAFCFQLKHYSYYGTFPSADKDLNALTINYLSDQLATDISQVYNYDWDSRTSQRHRKEILQFLGIQKFTQRHKQDLSQWLISKVFPQGKDVHDAVILVYEWLHYHKINRPSDKQLRRDINSYYYQYEISLFEQISSGISSASKQLADLCINGSGDAEIIDFTTLKSDPGNTSLDSILQEIDKLNFINSIEFIDDTIYQINPKILSRLRLRVLSETSWELKRHPKVIRYALMGVFFHTRKGEIIDALVELLILLIHKLKTKAQKKVTNTLMKNFQKVVGKNSLLMRIAEVSLNHPNSSIKETVYPIANERILQNLVNEYKLTGKSYAQEVHQVVRSSYSSHYRRMVPKLLDSIEFRSNNSRHQPVLDAIKWLKINKNTKQKYYELSSTIPIEGVVTPKLYDTTIEIDDLGNERVNKINYEICVLQRLRDKLRCKEIWVQGADRYKNPEEDLPQDFDQKRSFYYEDLGITQDAEMFVSDLKNKMANALKSFDKNLPDNTKIKILSSPKPKIKVSPLEKQIAPKNIHKLKSQIQDSWPMTNLLDILKESDLRVDFTSCFKTQRTSEKINREELQKRLLLCLYGLGTNTGLSRISNSSHGVNYKELYQTRKFYIHKANLRKAISKVVNATLAVRDPKIWGEGTASCASDSKKFGSWDQNLMAEWHARYGGRGVMIYWHVADKSTCIYSQLKRCSSSEAASMIEGVIKHCTDMSVDKQYVDTHGQSEVAFAFSHLLGFNLMPRLKHIAKQKLSQFCRKTSPFRGRI